MSLFGVVLVTLASSAAQARVSLSWTPDLLLEEANRIQKLRVEKLNLNGTGYLENTDILPLFPLKTKKGTELISFSKTLEEVKELNRNYLASDLGREVRKLAHAYEYLDHIDDSEGDFPGSDMVASPKEQLMQLRDQYALFADKQEKEFKASAEFDAYKKSLKKATQAIAKQLKFFEAQVRDQELVQVHNIFNALSRDQKAALKAVKGYESSTTCSFLPSFLRWTKPLNRKTSNKTSLLMAASQRGYKDVVQALVKHQVALNDQDQQGRTALMHAVLNAEEGTVKTLLLNVPKIKLDLEDLNGNTALGLAFDKAARTQDPIQLIRMRKIICSLIKEGARVPMGGSIPWFREIKSMTKTQHGNLPQFALANGWEDVTQALVKKDQKKYQVKIKARPKKLSVKEEKKWKKEMNQWEEAVKSGSPKAIFSFFKKGFDPNERVEFEPSLFRFPLEIVAESGNLAAVELLLSWGANPSFNIGRSYRPHSILSMLFNQSMDTKLSQSKRSELSKIALTLVEHGAKVGRYTLLDAIKAENFLRSQGMSEDMNLVPLQGLLDHADEYALADLAGDALISHPPDVNSKFTLEQVQLVNAATQSEITKRSESKTAHRNKRIQRRQKRDSKAPKGSNVVAA